MKKPVTLIESLFSSVIAHPNRFLNDKTFPHTNPTNGHYQLNRELNQNFLYLIFDIFLGFMTYI